MFNKAVFLDRDGTINKDFGYVYKKEQLQFVPGVLEALKKIQQAGFKILIITNQSGIGRGYFTLEQYQKFESFMLEQMADKGIIVDEVYYCPHKPEDHCDCRKPRTKMFELAAKDFDIEWRYSYVIGDSERDLAVCDSRNVQGIFFGVSGRAAENVIGLETWEEIANYILKE